MKEDIIFPSEFPPVYKKYPMYEGLWENWKACGFALFHEEILQEIKKFFYEPHYTKSLNYPFISTFVFYLNDFQDVDRAFLEAGGLTTKYGIIWMRYMIQDFYNAQGKIPAPEDLEFISIHLEPSDYSKYGYSSWKRLITQNLGAPVLKEQWKGTVGLYEAKRRVKQFFDLHGKPPSASQFPVLSENCRKGIWKPQGIITWRDFLAHILQKKLTTYYKLKRTWGGVLGLHRARLMIYKYMKAHQKIPVRTQFPSVINNCLKDNVWEPLGITSWTDLLWTIHTLSSEQIYEQFIFNKRSYTKRSWEGLDGMTDAVMALFEYHEEHKKYPSPQDFPTIARMCRNRRWKRWKVISWDDLMRDVFGKRI